jgi:hypothetical protein
MQLDFLEIILNMQSNCERVQIGDAFTEELSAIKLLAICLLHMKHSARTRLINPSGKSDGTHREMR